jgi:hypothetical protein
VRHSQALSDLESTWHPLEVLKYTVSLQCFQHFVIAEHCIIVKLQDMHKTIDEEVPTTRQPDPSAEQEPPTETEVFICSLCLVEYPCIHRLVLEDAVEVHAMCGISAWPQCSHFIPFALIAIDHSTGSMASVHTYDVLSFVQNTSPGERDSALGMSLQELQPQSQSRCYQSAPARPSSLPTM